MKDNMKKLLQIMMWTSLFLGIVILWTIDMSGALAFFLNALFAYIYVNKKDETFSYIGAGISIIMILINLVTPISIVDSIIWIAFSYVWIKNIVEV
jgi:hypothetical protein